MVKRKKSLLIVSITLLAATIAIPMILVLYNYELNRNNDNIIVSNPHSHDTGGNVTATQGFHPYQGVDNTVIVLAGVVFALLTIASFYLWNRESDDWISR